MHCFVSVRFVSAFVLALFVLCDAARAQEPHSHQGVLSAPQAVDLRVPPAAAGPRLDSIPPLIAAGPEPETAALALSQPALTTPVLPHSRAGVDLDMRSRAGGGNLNSKRPAALIGLYASFAALQGFDAHSTTRALDRGAVEANPLMRGIAGNAVGMLAVKAAGTAGVVYAGERLWKRNKTAAVLFMAAVNSAMVMVVRHNYGAVR